MQNGSPIDGKAQTVADTRIHGTTRKQVGSDFEANEKPSLGKLPVERFAFYHEVKRKVSRDGHISVNPACYSVPPEYLSREVWVRHDSRLVRIYDDRLQHIATHAVIESGWFRTAPKHIASRKINPVARGIDHLQRKMRLIASSSARWAFAVSADRGVEASRVLQAVIALSHKYSGDEVEAACQTAWQSGANNSRIIRTLLKRQSSTSQTTMVFIEEHPIIRPIGE